MSTEPNHESEIDELYDHMVNQLDHEPSTIVDWSFAMESKELSALQAAAAELDEEEFFLQIQEEVELVDEDGNAVSSNPLLSITRRAALEPGQVKQIAQKLIDLAQRHGLDYLGVDCYEALDEDVFHWFDLDGALAQISHFHAAGLPQDALLPWVFLIEADALKFLHATAETLSDAEFDRVDIYEEPDDQGRFALCVFVDGTNDEAELKKTFERISSLANSESTELVGIQFCSEDELQDSFDDNAEPSPHPDDND